MGSCEGKRYLNVTCELKRQNCGWREIDDDTVSVTAKRTKRILNGRVSRDRAWPWVASLRLKGVGHICGATLVSENWLVSAAHCFEEFVCFLQKAIKFLIFYTLLGQILL